MASWRRLMIGLSVAFGVIFGAVGVLYLLSTRYPEALVTGLLAVVLTTLVVRLLRGSAGSRSSL